MEMEYFNKQESFKKIIHTVHAYLIESPSEQDNSAAARELSMMLLCADERNSPCGFCLDCKKIKGNHHPDVTEIDVEDKKSISVESIRDFKRDFYYQPNEGRYRIYLIDGAQNMTVQAQNSLLKILEEPPLYVRFVLTTTQKQRILPTILSRLFSVYLPPEATGSLLEKLQARFPEKAQSELQSFVSVSGGYFKRAVALSLKEESKRRQNDVAQLFLLACKRQKGEYFDFGTKIINKDKLSSHARNFLFFTLFTSL